MAILMVKNKLVKRVSTGFSFKSLFFGIFYAMARNDMKGAIYQFVICLFTFGLAWLVIPFLYNKIYIKRLIEKGYEPYDEKSKNYLIQNLRYTVD